MAFRRSFKKRSFRKTFKNFKRGSKYVKRAKKAFKSFAKVSRGGIRL